MLTLPDLDDKHFRQIYDEAIARIPTLTEYWTDYNPQDTGVMLLEILAAMTEMQNFYLNQVGSRFYERYIKLVVQGMPGETTEELLNRFAQQCAQTSVAVTAQDYEQLTLRSPFLIDRVKASVENGLMCLALFRESAPLDAAEMQALREWLEPYRLLTARLRLRQVARLRVDVICRVALDPRLGRESVCREKLEALFLRMIREKDVGEALSLGNIRSEILSIREIVEIEELSIRENGRETPQNGRQGAGFLQVQSMNISFVKWQEGGAS